MGKDFPAVVSENQDNGSSSSAGNGKAVGLLLRDARQRLGEDLSSVSERLCIRQSHLEAIESGQYQDLPGSAYAVGFVRSYAEYLGLDSDEIVRRFRMETGEGFVGRTELVFPMAVSESSIPTIALLFLAIVLIGLAYGGWYWYRSADISSTEIVPALPDRLAALIHRPMGGNGTETVTADTGNHPETTEANPSAHEDVVPPQEEDTSVSSVARTPEQPPKPVDPVRVEETRSADAKANKDLKKIELKPVETPANEAAKTVDVVRPEDGGWPAQANATPSTSPTAQPAPPDQPASNEEGMSRIQLHADEDCWLEIRDSSGAMLYSRLLRKGEDYAVPGRPGLAMTVGNAGALTVSVDGKSVSPLGRFGAVRHNISLDPDRLLTAPPPAPPSRKTTPSPESSYTAPPLEETPPD